ncbi:MAG: hypothetical protein JWO08_4569 [Verrucomicrobiaceae bacterium]|nr:hypothetical protein [Verrucomicrobiaceae bacterium]
MQFPRPALRACLFAFFSFLAMGIAAHAGLGDNWFAHRFTNRQGVAYGSGLFVAVSADNGGDAQYSTDGTAWTTVNTGTFSRLAGISRIGAKFYAVASSELAASADGVTWAASTPFSIKDDIRSITGSGDTLVAVRNMGSSAGYIGIIYLSTNAGGSSPLAARTTAMIPASLSAASSSPPRWHHKDAAAHRER